MVGREGCWQLQLPFLKVHRMRGWALDTRLSHTGQFLVLRFPMLADLSCMQLKQTWQLQQCNWSATGTSARHDVQKIAELEVCGGVFIVSFEL